MAVLPFIFQFPATSGLIDGVDMSFPKWFARTVPRHSWLAKVEFPASVLAGSNLPPYYGTTNAAP